MRNTQPVGRPHRNHGLFSDHYLNVTLPARPDWKALADEAQDEAEDAVKRRISRARSGQEARRDTLDWLRVEFGVEKLGHKLEDFAAFGPDAFMDPRSRASNAGSPTS